MAKNYFDRYVWLIDTINRHGHISFKDISYLWAHSPVNKLGENYLPERTFHNHREAILDTFGIEIKCDRSLGYYIANSDDLEGDGIRQWLLESLSLNNLLNESSDMRDRILFEKIPSAQRWLSTIVNAMRDGKMLRMTYKSFWRDEPKEYETHPYCLKLFKQRWYLLAWNPYFERMTIYAVDRIYGIDIQTNKRFKMPEDFVPSEFFDNYYGIIANTESKVQRVVLKLSAGQANYLRSLPLHWSQEETERQNDYSLFELHLCPEFDFQQELLSMGEDVEVMEPLWFRKEMAGKIKRMWNKYNQA